MAVLMPIIAPPLSSRGPPLLPAGACGGWIQARRSGSAGQRAAAGRAPFGSCCSAHHHLAPQQQRVPGLMAASVWMTSWIGRPVLPLLISRPVPLITPLVSVWSSLAGEEWGGGG